MSGQHLLHGLIDDRLTSAAQALCEEQRAQPSGVQAQRVLAQPARGIGRQQVQSKRSRARWTALDQPPILDP